MSLSDSVFNNLRQKLDIMGYKQTLPLAAIPLVGSLFEDFVKTTESLRDSKKQIMELLEEKTCWELGVEPYKCDNSRLLQECNQLHLQIIKQQEEYEEKIQELNSKIRDLQTDNLHLQQQCRHLQQQLNSMPTKKVSNTNMKYTKDLKVRKPFITTVRSGNELPTLQPLQENNSNFKCTKCQVGYYQRLDAGGLTTKATNDKHLEQLENTITDLKDNIKFYQKKLEARDREIMRLNELLSGGRPPATLARECCYKNFDALNEDIDLLQREKMDSLTRMREYQEQMHEAMQRALDLEKANRSLQKQLDELKDAALLVETQANNEIAQREAEVEELKKQLKDMMSKETKQLQDKQNKQKNNLKKPKSSGQECTLSNMDKHKINEKINELTQKESELKQENEYLHHKISKLKTKLQSVQKALKEIETEHAQHLDEEKIRLKSERNFYQKEYLRLLNKTGSDKETEFLQTQIKSKDEELRVLRSELCLKQSQALVPCFNDNPGLGNSLPSTAHTSASSSSSDCVQAVVLRIERERDCARAEVERIKCERDTLKEKLLCITKMHDEQMHTIQQRYDILNERLRQLEKENRELKSLHMPTESHITILKEQLEYYKQQQYQVTEENNKLQQSYNQLKMLHEQTERSLTDYQNKFLMAQRQIESSNMRLNSLDSNRESTLQEANKLRAEVAAIKQTYVLLENEKDKILTQLDNKTELVYQLENELKTSKEKRNCLEKQVTELEEQYNKLQNQARERDSELHESKSLKQQLSALKTSRDQAIQENVRLTNDLAENQAEILILKKQLKDSEKEIESLKQQLKKYVEEVKKAEDLLMQKEKEREEMLDHYRSLSHDACLLEGNNQSLESEAAEYKRQVKELESDIGALKKELCCRNNKISELEDKIATLTAKTTCLEHKLDESLGELQLLKTDLKARKELCDKLDIEKDKLNAELKELNEIKRKVELENEQLRLDIERSEQGKQMSAKTLEELLTKTRCDLQEQIKTDSKLSQELVRLKQQNEELLKDLALEKRKREQHQNLVHEYQVQNQELRHNLTDDRFRQARSREQSPRFPTHTL